jgi:pimeloyl-[acyl-carrier protein] methyl ester esterase
MVWPIVLLPGMDGAGELFAAFVRSAPTEFEPIVIPLPDSGSYEELLEAIRGALPPVGRFIVLGESFSGPLALRVARDAGSRVSGVVLCNSFISPPRAMLLKAIPWPLIFRLRPPRMAVRWLFAGWDAPPELVADVQAAMAKTWARVLAARIRMILRLDDAALLQSIAAPVLYLRGTRDALLPERVSAATRAAAPRTLIKDIAAPHLLLQRAPEEAWKAIGELMRRVQLEAEVHP